jgi:hypothetical protein
VDRSNPVLQRKERSRLGIRTSGCELEYPSKYPYLRELEGPRPPAVDLKTFWLEQAHVTSVVKGDDNLYGFMAGSNTSTAGGPPRGLSDVLRADLL